MKSIARIFFAILIILTAAATTTAQNLTVRSMKPNPSDLTACTYERLDINNRPCALVKVQIPLEGMEFEGSIIRPVEYKAGEYWVYMPAGTKMINIKHSSVKPLFVRFTDYDGVGPLQAKVTYILDLDKPASGTAQTPTEEVTFKVTPAGASLFVDDEEREVVDGVAKVPLTHGTHRCNILCPGYKAVTDEFVVRKGMAKRVYELEPKSGAVSAVSAAATPTPTPAPVQPPVEKPFETFTVNGVSFEMVRVKGGSFMMGSNDPDAFDAEKPVHSENVATFHIGRTEVTQDLWQAVMGSNPSDFRGGNLPVETVSWDDCQTFCERLSQLTGHRFRLPTEAEWEYAARGGNRSHNYKYSGGDNLDSVGWYGPNSGGKTHPVGTKQANELGLYDMSGNVREWTSDLWSDDYNSPRGTGSYGSNRVLRGGGWLSDARICRSADRSFYAPGVRNFNLGLRLAF